WNKRLGTVYNRGLSEGFYRGRAWQHWSGLHGSKATQHREFVGIVKHFYPKISVTEILVQASELDTGQSCIITGPTTGIVRFEAKNILLDEKPVLKAKQGDLITLVIPKTVRKNDKLFKIVETKGQRN
ncbi:MAG: U32 family peptidase, partial [Patescibacteria group bacterium]